MKYIIMADGDGKRWNNYTGVPKHLVKVNEERLIDRTVRLLKENDIKDIIIMASDKRYKVKGTELIPQSKRGYEIDRFDFQFLKEEVCFLYGDVYYTEEAMKTIVNEDKGDFTYFGRFGSSKIKQHGEIFAIRVKNYEKFKEACSFIREGLQNGTIRRGIGWETYKYISGKDVNMNLTEFKNWMNEKHPFFIQINDETDDFDSPEDYDRWMKMCRGAV